MEPDRDNLPAEPTNAQLREAWRRRSLATGWRTPDDWHNAAVDEVLSGCRNRAPAPGEAGQAVVGEGDLTAACAGLGRARAQAGIGIAETIDDLAALFAVLGHGGETEGKRPGLPGGGDRTAGEKPGVPGGDPSAGTPLRLIRAIAEGWVEESLDQLAQGGCEDPLSGLATVAHLRTRLVYREAEHCGTSPADTHRLLVVRLSRRPDPWRRMALAIGVGHDLRAAFPDGETLSMAKPGSAIALVRAHGDLPLRYARLRRSIHATFGTQIRMIPLPGVLTDALRLVDDLAR
jgi:hypothetical protein